MTTPIDLKLDSNAVPLVPANAAYMAFTDLKQTRMLGYTAFNQSAVTTVLMGLMGTNPAVRHRAGATDEILAFLQESGLDIREDMRIFEDGGDAEALADGLVEDGFKLFCPYPLRAGRFADADHLVPPALWARLNSKAHLPDLAPAEALAPRRQIGLDDTLSDLELPAFLKSADAEATAWGYAVRYCETSKDVAEAQESLRSQGVSRGLLETAMPIERCWCANLIVTEDGVTYAGAAEQLFEAPGRQLGNVIDPENPFPDAGIALACAVADEARRMGFIGVVGLDIGRTTSGQMIVFDPNFRFNACTVQVLLHDSAAARGVGSVSRSFSGTTTLSCAACIDQVRGAVADGWFVPLRVIDPAYMAVAEGTCLVSGFVMGADHAEAERRHDALLDRLA